MTDQPATPAGTDQPPEPKKQRAPYIGKRLKPSDREKEIVKNMASHGIPVKDIAMLINRGEDYVRENYRRELDTAKIGKQIDIYNALHARVVGKPAEYDRKGRLVRAEVFPETACIIFSAKTICGLKERDVHEHTGKDGGPIEVTGAKRKLTTLLDRTAEAEAENEASRVTH
jgi:hypothetical protein